MQMPRILQVFQFSQAVHSQPKIIKEDQPRIIAEDLGAFVVNMRLTNN